MNNAPQSTFQTGRTPESRANSAPDAVFGWVEAMGPDQRVRLAHRLRGAATTIEKSQAVSARIDRRESALVVALFFEYARLHKLSPGEAQSLLANPGTAGPRTLEKLGLTEAKPQSPGRWAQTQIGRNEQKRPPRVPGR